jgi:hypothetical protein
VELFREQGALEKRQQQHHRCSTCSTFCTHPVTLVEGARLPHRCAVGKLVDVTLELLDVVLPALVLVDLLLEHLHEDLPGALGRSIVLGGRPLLLVLLLASLRLLVLLAVC